MADSQRPGRLRKRSLWEITCGAAAAVLYLLLRSAGDHPVVLTGAQRAPLYTVLAEAAIGLLAFGITPAVILLTLAPGERLKALLRHHNDGVRRSVIRALWSVLSLLIVAVAGLGIDQSDPGTRWVRYVVLAAAVASIVAVSRLISNFSGLMTLINVDKLQGERPPLQRVPRRRAG